MQWRHALGYTFVLTAAASLWVGASARAAERRSLAERLGYKPTTKLLIVNGDDAGMCHSANVATIESLEKGHMRSATIMVPCPWFPEIAEYARSHPERDFGVHLCHTSEWTKYRWGPIAPREEVPGLVDSNGFLWPAIADVYAHATPEQALIESRAQIRRALAAGVDVTHLDSHMGAMQYRADYLKAYLQLATEFDLPVRMASQETLARQGHPEIREQVAALGIVSPDFLIFDESNEAERGVKAYWLQTVRNLKPGVTELYIHASVAGDELRAITRSWSTRNQEFELFTRDEDMTKLIAEQEIVLIGYRPLRELQRKERARAAPR